MRPVCKVNADAIDIAEPPLLTVLFAVISASRLKLDRDAVTSD